MPIGSPAELAFEGPMFGAQRDALDSQKKAYRYLKTIGEVENAINILSRSVGRASLKGSTEQAQAVLDMLFSGPMSMRSFLEQAARHLATAAEFYLVGRKPTEAERLAYSMDATSVLWETVSIAEITNQGSVIQINPGGGAVPITLTPGDAAIRIWTPDPEFKNVPSAPLWSSFPVLNEIELATNKIEAQLTSRFTGNGILSIPESWETPPAPGQSPNPAQRKTSMMRTITAVASMAMQDPSSPSARLPIVVTKPDGSTDTIDWHTFWSELDAVTVENREKAILRFALGMDLPPEQVLGLGGQAQGQQNGSNRWNVWAIEESTIALHVEPMIVALVDAITQRIIRPITGDVTATIEADLTKLRIRPDRSKESIDLYDRGIVGADTVRRENGFEETDAPTDKEIRDFLLRRIASGSASPEQVSAAARQLGVDLPVSEGQGALQPAPQNQATQVADQRMERSNREVSRPHSLTASVEAPASENLIKCEAIVLRLLERVGSRIIQSHSTTTQLSGILATEAHVTLSTEGVNFSKMLSGPNSFGLSLLDPRTVEDRESAQDLLDDLTEFAEYLVHSRKPYSRELLVKALEERLSDG